MKILELFSGTECLSNAFRARGHECFTVDWDRRFPSSLHTDIMQLTAERILTDFGRPDIIWAGCDCTTFSVGDHLPTPDEVRQWVREMEPRQ